MCSTLVRKEIQILHSPSLNRQKKEGIVSAIACHFFFSFITLKKDQGGRAKTEQQQKLLTLNVSMKGTQLPGRLFSPSDSCKKLSHHFLLHFSIGMGSYDHHAKYQGVFP